VEPYLTHNFAITFIAPTQTFVWSNSVIKGVIKGVGRLAIRATENVVQNAPEIARLASEMIALLNRLGHKNAEAWLKALDVTCPQT
jgi:hypothetical protein